MTIVTSRVQVTVNLVTEKQANVKIKSALIQNVVTGVGMLVFVMVIIASVYLVGGESSVKTNVQNSALPVTSQLGYVMMLIDTFVY